MVEMRTSTGCWRTSTLKRPSCGWRFSEMSSPAINLSRRASAAATRSSVSVCAWRWPSTRMRMRSLSSCGSMWMSEAPTCVASWNSDCSSLTTGASSAPRVASTAPKSTRFSPRSCCSSLARPLISSVRRYTRSSASAISLSATTTGSMSFFRMRESSSKANKSVGSAIPTSIFAPRSQRQGAEAACRALGKLQRDIRLEVVMLEVDEADVELARQRLGNIELGGEPHVDEYAAEPAAGALLLVERELELFRRDDFLRHQDVAEAQPLRTARGADRF